MWNEQRSLLLSKWFVVLVAVGLTATLVFSPMVIRWVLTFSDSSHPEYAPFYYVTFFVGAPFCYFMLYSLYRLLSNMSRGQVFIHKNVTYMRRISWACLMGAVLSLASALYWIPWLAVTLAAGFAGLIVRVFKNVLAEAIALKEENDFTI